MKKLRTLILIIIVSFISTACYGQSVFRALIATQGTMITLESKQKNSTKSKPIVKQETKSKSTCQNGSCNRFNFLRRR